MPPLHKQARELVRIRYGHNRNDYVDYIEYVADCAQCKCRRTMRRDRYTNLFAIAWYDYADGYLAPPGTRWDRALLYELYGERYPVEGQPRVIDLRP
jgi:hypothetical protein